MEPNERASGLEEKFSFLKPEYRPTANDYCREYAENVEALAKEKGWDLQRAWMAYSDLNQNRYQWYIEACENLKEFHLAEAAFDEKQFDPTDFDEFLMGGDANDDSVVFQKASAGNQGTAATTKDEAKAETTGPAKDFIGLVNDYQSSKQCSRTEALRHVANENPDIHAEYIKAHCRKAAGQVTLADLKRFLPGKANPENLESLRKTGMSADRLKAAAFASAPDFIELTKAYEKKFGCKRSVAMSAIAREFPLAHAAYLENYNRERRDHHV